MWHRRLTYGGKHATVSGLILGAPKAFPSQRRVGGGRHVLCFLSRPCGRRTTVRTVPRATRDMSRFLEEPAIDPIRGYFSQLCVMLTGIATGAVEPLAEEAFRSRTYHMGRRDGFHVVVAHLASSESLREAADKCVAFGRGVGEGADAHPYGPEWAEGFAQATFEAAADLAMYAATATIPSVDKPRLRAARTAARHLSPLAALWSPRSVVGAEPPRSHHEW